MCQAQHHIKLCTCNADLSIENAGWILYRKKKSSYNILYVGETKAKYSRAQDTFHENSMHFRFFEAMYESDLNNFNCFDFNFTPEYDDRLFIKVSFEKETYTLKFIFDNKWKPLYENPDEHALFLLGKLGNEQSWLKS